MKEIVIASHNDGKVYEIRGLLKKYNFKIFSLKKFSHIEPKENGKTFIENSVIKAVSALKITGLPSIVSLHSFPILLLSFLKTVYFSVSISENIFFLL